MEVVGAEAGTKEEEERFVVSLGVVAVDVREDFSGSVVDAVRLSLAVLSFDFSVVGDFSMVSSLVDFAVDGGVCGPGGFLVG